MYVSTAAGVKDTAGGHFAAAINDTVTNLEL
jgi:hypothetical protein